MPPPSLPPKVKWPLAFLVALAVFAVARAAVQQALYFPLVHRDHWVPSPTVTITPTRTRTPTPTRTVTPFRTATPTRTATPEPGLHITHIEYAPDQDPLDEWVSIKNGYADAVDMSGWLLKDDSGNTFTFPDNFILRTFQEVKVWTKDGQNSSTNLYWGLTQPVWNDHNDCAYLRDPELEEPVASICYSDTLGFWIP